MVNRVGVLFPEATSVGGNYQLDNVTASINRVGGDKWVAVPVLFGKKDIPGSIVWKSRGNASVRLGLDLEKLLARHDIDALLCPGSFVPAIKQPAILWPGTVGPFDRAFRKIMSVDATTAARQRTLHLAMRLACSRANAFIFSSNYTRGLFSGAVGAVAQRPSTVIHPARPDAEFRWNDADTDNHILSPARVRLYKQLPPIVHGFYGSEVCRSDNTALHIVGGVNKPAEPSLRAAIASGDRSELVHVTDGVPRDELYQAYLRCRAMIFGSLSENAAAWVLIDAMAFGVPCVSSSTSSTPEIARDGVLYANPFDGPTISRELDRLLSSESLRLEISERARLRIAELPDWDTIGTRVVEFLDSLS